MRRTQLIVLLGLSLLVACNKQSPRNALTKEDKTAKKMLQGIWINDDSRDVAFKAKGDTIYYPDMTSVPMYFKIVHDTLIMRGSNVMRYRIIKQAPHLFVFENQAGDQVKLVKSDDANSNYAFVGTKPVVLNQNKLIKRDTVIMVGKDRYHGYVQVNPTTYKVILSSFNDDGVEVENVYHDNIIHLSIFKGAQRLFSRDFRKHDFAKFVPSQYLTQSILSDLILRTVDEVGIHYLASLAIPDSQSSYQVDVCVDFNGKLSMRIL